MRLSLGPIQEVGFLATLLRVVQDWPRLVGYLPTHAHETIQFYLPNRVTDRALFLESSLPHPREAEEPSQRARRLEPVSPSLSVSEVDQGKDEDPAYELTVGDQESVSY